MKDYTSILYHYSSKLSEPRINDFVSINGTGAIDVSADTG